MNSGTNTAWQHVPEEHKTEIFKYVFLFVLTFLGFVGIIVSIAPKLLAFWFAIKKAM